MGIMTAYAAFINNLPGPINFAEIESYWIEQVKLFFSAKPFKLNSDSSRSMASCVATSWHKPAQGRRRIPGQLMPGPYCSILSLQSYAS